MRVAGPVRLASGSLSLLFAVLLFPADTASRQAAPAPAPPPNLYDVQLAEFPPQAEDIWYSLDAKRFAWKVKTANKSIVVVDTKEGPAFDEVSGFFFSPDGQRWAYRGKRVNRWVVVTEAGESPAVEEVGSLTFAADGRLIYSAKRRNNWVMVIEGKESPEFDEVWAPAFLPDGRFLYAGKRAKKWQVMVEETPGPLFDEIAALKFTPDGRIFYLGKRAKSWVLVADGVESPGPGFEQIAMLTFSPNNQRMAFAGKRAKKWMLVVDGKEGPQFDDISSLAFSPDGQRVAYAGKRAKKWVMILDAKEGPVADRFTGLTFSRDSRRLVYAAGRDKPGWSDNIIGCVVIDGQEGPSFEGTGWKERKSGLSELIAGKLITLTTFAEEGPLVAEYSYQSGTGLFASHVTKYLRLAPSQFGVSAPVISLDGNHVAYAAQRGKHDAVIFLDGEPGPIFEAILSTPVFSPDGQHLAYLAWQKDKIIEVVDGKNVADFPAQKGVNFVEQLTFSPDSQRRAYVLGVGGELFQQGGTGKARRRVVVDGQAGKEYDVHTIATLAFRPDSRHLAHLVQG
ncbi:MAG: hypothetical protein AAB289_12120, partial [Chloroflexota bacterium]